MFQIKVFPDMGRGLKTLRTIRKGRTMIKYTALRQIEAGEQLFLNYGYEP